MTTTAVHPIHCPSSTYDEMSMHQSLLFSDSLKDLKNLRTQLYSAAEYFELAYTHDDQTHIVVDTLKDYTIKALVNTVDHLGSVTYKVNDLLDEKLKDISVAEFRVSCIEQRLRTCQEYIDREGVAQQASVTKTPRYHKRYVLRAGQTMNGSTSPANLEYKGYGIDEDDWLQIRTAVRTTIRESPSFVRKGRSASPGPRPSRLPGSFSFTSGTPKKERVADKRPVSPKPATLSRSGSLASRPTTPKSSSRPTTLNSALERQRKYISDSWRSASMRIHNEKDHPKPKDMERHPSKSKRLLKALLSRQKNKKDDTLDTYLDEY